MILKLLKYFITGSILIGSTSNLMGQKILCYKNNITTSLADQNMKLKGKGCENHLSANQMKKSGWKLDDVKIVSNKENYNHIYIFSKKNVVNQNKFLFQQKKIVKYDLSEQQTIISNVTKTTGFINIGNLKVGQSGIIIHNDGDNKLIVARAVIVNSDSSGSTIEFNFKDLLKQDAIPTTKLKPQNNDIFILNHLYNSSLLIVPNLAAKKIVNSIFPKHIFLAEDLFAANLKINNNPVPKKDDIQKFALTQQLGTIFIVVGHNLYTLDTLSMKVIDKINLLLPKYKAQVPLFSNITDIEKNFWNFGDSKIENYNSYYKNELGL